MSTHKNIERVCVAATIFAVLVTLLLMRIELTGSSLSGKTMGYEERLFDDSFVHTIDIRMDDWDSFIDSCTNEEYVACKMEIDGESYANVGIRAKGKTSLSNVEAMDSDRYSFKIEFDHYDKAMSYYGLDKLCLNNLIQDNTMMKDYVSYKLMGEFGVAAPLCSYTYITVNGEDWGLYLAVEGVEESFLERNYGDDYGELYKPDSSEMGGGRENGQGSSDVKLQYIDENMSSYAHIFENAKTDVSKEDESRLIQSLKMLSENEAIASVVDVDAVIRYFVVHNFLCNGDSYTGNMVHNYYLYEKDGQMSMIPWDYNLAFGGFQSTSATSTVNEPIDTPVLEGSMEERPMVNWIFQNTDYTEMYHRYFSEFLQISDFSALITQTAELIAPYVEKDPSKFCTYEEFKAGAETLEAFCLLRKESIEGQLAGTIPSTTEGQKSDLDALIDASHLTITAMGSMGNTMGDIGRMEKLQKPEGGELPQKPEGGELPQKPEGGELPQKPEGGELPQRPEGGELPQKPEGGELPQKGRK